MALPVAAVRGHVVQPAAAAGAWTPASLASLAGWWDFSDAGSLWRDAAMTVPCDADGHLIWTAGDKSGGGHHFVQAAAAARPGYKVGIQNGLAAAFFDNDTSHLMDAGGFSGVFATSAATIFAAYNPNGDNSYIVINHSGSDGFWRYSDGNAYMGVFRNPRVDAAYLAEDTGDLLYAITSNNSAYKVWSGGVAKLSTTGAFASAATMRISDDASGATRFNSGWMYEIVVCNTVLSTTDLNLLGGYLSGKWGLTWSAIP